MAIVCALPALLFPLTLAPPAPLPPILSPSLPTAASPLPLCTGGDGPVRAPLPRPAPRRPLACLGGLRGAARPPSSGCHAVLRMGALACEWGLRMREPGVRGGVHIAVMLLCAWELLTCERGHGGGRRCPCGMPFAPFLEPMLASFCGSSL